MVFSRESAGFPMVFANNFGFLCQNLLTSLFNTGNVVFNKQEKA